MRLSSSAGKWWLPSRLALLMGFGALSAASAEVSATGAAVDTMPDRASHGAATQLGGTAAQGGLVVRIRNGTVEIAESGGRFREMRLGDTVEARRLKQLLEDDPAARSETGLRLGPTIFAGSGGESFHWVPVLRNPRESGGPGGSDNPRATPDASGTSMPPAKPEAKPAKSADKG